MPITVHTPPFREEFTRTRYPFSDRADLTTTNGLTIDRGVFLDASLYPIGATDSVRINTIVVTTGLVTINLGDSIRSILASGSFDPLATPDVLGFTDSRGRDAGIAVCDPVALAAFQAWPEGSHTFLDEAAEFAASCTIPTPEIAVRAIGLEDGSISTGDVWLVGEDGVVLREEGGAIRIDIVGDPLFARRLCEDIGKFSPPRFLRTINGYAGDKSGEFKLTVDDTLASDVILRIYPLDAQTLAFAAVGQTIVR